MGERGLESDAASMIFLDAASLLFLTSQRSGIAEIR
jgi:hypothetical protein